MSISNVHRNTLGPGEAIGEGDSFVLYDFLPRELAATAFERLIREVEWNKMTHRGGEVPRLVAVEGRILQDGSYPVYRHPADESPPLLPFSPTVEQIRQHVEDVLHEPVNHVLIQHYRSGADYISEHSDKAIDVVRGSRIVNVSLGAQRVMTLRTKKDALANPDGNATDARVGDERKRTVQRVPLPHNSIFVMGLETNAKWMHSIRTDKRPLSEKTDAELYMHGERISLTFRTIGTFLTHDERFILDKARKERPARKQSQWCEGVRRLRDCWLPLAPKITKATSTGRLTMGRDSMSFISGWPSDHEVTLKEQNIITLQNQEIIDHNGVSYSVTYSII